MKVVDNFGTDFVIIENPVEYLNAFIWLTTTKMQDIWEDETKQKYISGLSSAVSKVEFDIPYFPKAPNKSEYWKAYAWVWNYLPIDALKWDYIHFRMNSINEYEYPPIPKVLYDFYLTHKDLVDYHEVAQ